MSDATALQIANAIVVGTGIAYLCACVAYGVAGRLGLSVMFGAYAAANVGVWMTAKGW